MEKNFKLKDIPYKRMDFQEIQRKLDEFAEQITQAGDYDTVKKILLGSQELQKEVNENHTLAMIRMYQDSTDEYYAKEAMEQDKALAMRDSSKLNQALISSPFAEDINREFGREFLLILDKDNRLLSEGKDLQVKEQELMNRYQKMKATMKFEFQGKTLSEGELRPFRENPDREVRKECLKVMYRGYLDRKQEFEEILDELVKTRIKIAKANGFDSYLDYKNLEKGRREYGEKELTAFRKQIKEEVIPVMKALYEQQKERLGLETLTIYDYNLIFPDGNPRPAGEIQELCQAAGEMYHKLSPEIGAFYDEMLEHELIDAAQSPNKITGIGFCTTLDKTGIPFVFANSNGTMSDVSVLTHELGHAWQAYCSMKKQPLQEYYWMANDLVEIPSKTMELFAYPYAEAFFGKDAEKFLYMHQYEIISELTFYTMVDEYEGWLYTNPQASMQERYEKFEQLFQEYNPGVDNREFREEIHAGAMLFGNMGVYMYPKYLISYVLSEMCALEFKERMDANPEQAWKDYELFCATGGSMEYVSILQQSGLSPAYVDGTVARALTGLKQRLGTEKR